MREHYAVQARLYAIAADRLRGHRRLAGLLFAFVRHGIVVPVRDRRRHARDVDGLARAAPGAWPRGGAPVTAPLHPRGTLRARFEPVAGGELFRRLGVGARSCDLGDEGLYLAEELVAADAGSAARRPRGARDPRARADDRAAPGLDAPAARSARARCATLVGDICRVAKLELDAAADR